jgi:hypothetical protein
MEISMFTAVREKVQESVGPLFSAPASERRRAEQILNAALAKAKKLGPICEQFILTPALAELLLARNPNNRNISRVGLDREIADMKRGDWKLNGETIIVADTGELNDGQHRCQAVVTSGVAIKTFMVFGVSRESRDTIDQGIKKSVCHYVAMAGHGDPNNLARAGNLAWQYFTHTRFTRSPEFVPTPAQVLEFIRENPTLDNGLPLARLAYKGKMGSVGLFTAMHFIFSTVDSEAATSFLTVLTDNFGYKGKTDPLYVLRKRLTEGNRALSDTERGAFIIKAWNAWRSKESIRVLKFVDGEDFPIAE